MTAEPWHGRVIDGRYVVESVLGQGGMGIVLRARHQFTGAQVAIKMLHRDLMLHADVQARFLAEAKTPSTIGHPGIVQVLDAGKTPEGELYLVMELLSGRTLRQAMYPSAPPLQITRRIVLELLDALAAAHARGIVHRDLKPDNVFLVGPSATVKLLDFGIAKVIENATRAGGFTAAGAVLGTLAYMAPEQLTDASTVDARTDLWAVGVMLYELISGRLPYRPRNLADLMTLLVTRDPDPISSHTSVSPAIEAFFARALARDRDHRFGSAHELATALAALPFDGSAQLPVARPTGSTDTVGTMASAVPQSGYHPVATAAPSAPSVVAPSYVAPSASPPTPPAPVPAAHAPPPPHAPPPAPPPPRSAPDPAQPPTAARSGSSTGLWIALGVCAFVAAGVVAFVLARDPKHADTTHDAAPIVVHDANSPGDADPWTPAKDPVYAVCEADCGRFQSCGLVAFSCIGACQQDFRMRSCLKTATTCDELAICTFSACSIPTGRATCAETVLCQQHCLTTAQGAPCLCACSEKLAPEHALTLLRFTACAATRCVGRIADLEQCVAQQCADEVALCRGTM